MEVNGPMTAMTRRRYLFRYFGSLSLAAAVLNIGCGSRDAVIVGSKNFTEQLILGEIVAQKIEACAGLPVLRRFNLGGTLLAHQAITSGEIDIYPEYTGTALMNVLDDPPSRDADEVMLRVRDEYRKRWGVRWLDPLGFENTFAIAIPEPFAQEKGIRTLTDAASSGVSWRLGVGYEFEQRPDGLPGLLESYPLDLDGAPRSMELGLLYRAIGQGQVNMIAANSTDGMLTAMNLRALEDDKRFFPPYEAAILVREATLARFPEMLGCLEDLSRRTTAEQMRKMNYAVDGEGRAVADVAREHLGRSTVR